MEVNVFQAIRLPQHDGGIDIARLVKKVPCCEKGKHITKDEESLKVNYITCPSQRPVQESAGYNNIVDYNKRASVMSLMAFI